MCGMIGVRTGVRSIAMDKVLDRARAGDDRAFGELTDPFMGELRLHCYRILGSVQDAEDVLTETLRAGWRGLGGFEERASLRTWLYRIATNRCLNALRASARRPRPVPAVPSWAAEPTRRGEPSWLWPFPDAMLDDVPDRVVGPEARYEAQEAIALAFIAAVQKLPPRQRAALVLRDVLGFRSSEGAAMLWRGGAADRRRVVHDAAGDAGISGSGGDRRVPAVGCWLARSAAVPADTHPGQRAARLRVLCAGAFRHGVQRARDDRADPRRGPDRGDY